jgi:hypothetical protein
MFVGQKKRPKETTKGLKRTPVACYKNPYVEKAQALQMAPTWSIIMAGCRSSKARSKGQLSKGVRTQSTSSARTVSIKAEGAT